MEQIMELSQKAVDQIKAEIEQALASSAQARGVDSAANSAICANKDLILGFLKTLVALIPGAIGKLVGQLIITAAEAWFSKQCPK
jgi:hypothetical protein